jgi:hypothetical protein
MTKEEKNFFKKSHSIYNNSLSCNDKLPFFLSNKNHHKHYSNTLISYLRKHNIYFFSKVLPLKDGFNIIKHIVKIRNIPLNYSLYSIGNDLKEYSIINDSKYIIDKLNSIQKKYLIHFIVKHGNHIRCIVTPKYNQTQLKLIRYINSHFDSSLTEQGNFEKLLFIFMKEYSHQKNLLSYTHFFTSYDDYDTFIKNTTYHSKDAFINEDKFVDDLLYKRVIDALYHILPTS